VTLFNSASLFFQSRNKLLQLLLGVALLTGIAGVFDLLAGTQFQVMGFVLYVFALLLPIILLSEIIDICARRLSLSKFWTSLAQILIVTPVFLIWGIWIMLQQAAETNVGGVPLASMGSN